MESFSDEHEALRATVRQFLSDKSDEQAVRTHMATDEGWNADLWKQLAEEVGLAGLIIPEEHGGAGFGYVELCVVAEEMGRALLCAPYLSTAVFATNAILRCTSKETQAALLPGLASGESTATVACFDDNGRWDLASIETSAVQKDGDWVLDGTKARVLDGHTADVLLVVARTADGLELFQIEGDAEGVTRESIPALDLTRKLAKISLAGTKATRISEGDQSANLERVLALTLAALTAEQCGGTQACLDMAVDYAKTRLQFGRPIGSFQAIKHKCADILIEVEFSKSAAYSACFTAADCIANDTGWDDLLLAATMAKSYCSEAYYHAAAENIQIHGGMGFTWEHPAHLYYKRAKASELLFGDGAHHREALADQVGL